MIKKSLKKIIQEVEEQGIIDALGDGVSIQGTDLKILYENKIQKNIYGNHVGEYCYEAYQKKESVCQDCPLIETFKDGKVHSTEREATTNNHLRYFEITASPIRDAEGSVIAGIETVRDVTDRENANQSLRESEERYRQISEATFEGIIIHDKGKILNVNQNFATMFGYDKSELIGMNGFELFARESRDSSVNKIMSGYEKSYEATGLRKDGTTFHMEIRGKSAYYKGNTARIAVVKDITEQKQAEETLRNSEERFRAVAENANDAIISVDSHGEIIFWNLKAEIIFGYSAEEIVGKSATLIIPERFREAHQKGLNRLVTTGKSKIIGKTIEMFGLGKDGKEFPIELTNSLWEVKGETFFTAIIRDISERKHSEEVIERQVSRLSALRSIDKAIISSLDLDVTLEVFLTHVLAQLHIDAASVLILNKHTQMLEYVNSKGFRTDALKYTRLKLGESNAGRAAIERHIVNIPDLHKDSSGFAHSQHFTKEKFVSYFAVPLIAKSEVMGILEVFHRSPLNVDSEWIEFLEAIADQGAIALDNSFLFKKFQRSNIDLTLAYDRTIEGWSRALDYRDKETEGHSQRVTEMTIRMAQEFRVKDQELVHIRRGALLHDIGKMGVPDNILFKPGKLTDEEWRIMKLHPVNARDLLYPIEYLRPAIDIPYCHHEKWDGTGYPRGLKGVDIPLAARIFAVVDVWDALRSDRPYRPAWSNEKTREHIHSLGGTHFDAQVIKTFLKMERN